MEVRWLVSFLALYRHRHFGTAAKELGISQPALSLQIQSLEARLTAPVLRRRPGTTRPFRPLQFTEIGDELFLRAGRIVQEVDAATFAVQALSSVPAGTVRIGIMPEYREPVAATVAKLLERIGDQSVLVEERKSSVLVEQGIHDGSIQLGVITALSHMVKAVTSEWLDDAPVQLIVNKGHSLLGKLPQGLLDRASSMVWRERFVLPTSAPLERMAFNYVFRGKFVPKIAVETTGAEAALAHVRATPSLMTILALPFHINRAGLAFLPFDQPDDVSPSALLIWRGTAPTTEAARHAAAILALHFKDSREKRARSGFIWPPRSVQYRSRSRS
jgi:DNA-binding transcriptional LysR family regulator